MANIPGRIPGRERWEVEDKLILSSSTDKQGELAIYAGTAGEKAVAIYDGANEVFNILATSSAKSLTLQTADTLDPTITLKTTRTAHQLNIYLDESMVGDKLVIEGKTAGVHTNLSLIALDGKNAVVYLQSGSNFGYLNFDSTDNLSLVNYTQDKDIFLQINDGGTTKTITWDADVDKLKHSAGLFNFDDDNLDTAGVYKVSGTQVVGARVIDARCDDAINSGDATTDGVIDSLRDAMIAHGLIAAA